MSGSNTSIVPFVGGSYEYRSHGVSMQRSINLYPQKIDNSEGKVNMTLMYTEGSQTVGTIGTVDTAFCRGMYYSSTGPNQVSQLYAVYGNKFYRIKSDYTYIEIGDVASGTGPVGISDNGFDVVCADGVNLYKCDINADDFIVSSTWQAVNLPLRTGTTDQIHPSQVGFLAQRLIINSQFNEFYFSQLASTNFADGLTEGVGVPNFYSAEQSADAIRSLIIVNNKIYLFGDRSYEIWAAGGNSDSDPFTFMQGSASQIGVQSPRSVATIQDKCFWLGSSDAGRNNIYMSVGLNDPIRISTNAIEHEIGQMPDPGGGVGFCWTNEGSVFYAITFQQAERTFVFDLSTSLWHERSRHDWVNGADLAWEPMFAVTAFNKVLYGSSTGNRLLLLDPYRYLDYDGRPIVRKRIGPIYWADMNPIVLRELLIDMEVGTTPLLSGLGRDPQAMLRISREGRTWINFDWRSIGSQGDYYTTVKWQNLGMGRTISAELTFSDPSPIIIYGARLRIQSVADR